MNRCVRPLGWAWLMCALCLSSPLAAQEVGLSYVTAESDHVEFPTPMGFNASVLIELSPSVHARLGLVRVYDETTKMGTVCQVYSPRIECNPEVTNTSMRL